MIGDGRRDITALSFRTLFVVLLFGMFSGSVRAQRGNITTVAGGGPATISKLNGGISNVASTGEVGQIAWDGTHQVFYFPGKRNSHGCDDYIIERNKLFAGGCGDNSGPCTCFGCRFSPSNGRGSPRGCVHRGATVSLPITPPANFISGTAPGGTCTGPPASQYGTAVCRVGNLANGGTASVAITIQPSTSGVLTSALTVSSDLTDPNPANDTATISTQVDPSSGGGGTGGGSSGGSGGSGGSGSCNCTLTGSYLNPVQGVDVSGDPLASPSNKFIVTATIDNTNNFTTITVSRHSDGKVLLPDTAFPITAHCGFSPDENRIAIHAVSIGSQEDEIWVYDLSVAPAKQVVHYRLPVVSYRLQFSPSGQYFVLTALVAQGRTEIDIYRVAGVSTEDRVFQTSFPFQSVSGVNEDVYGAVNWGFSPDSPETSFVFAYGNGQNTFSLNIANLTSPRVVPVLSRNITATSAFCQ